MWCQYKSEPEVWSARPRALCCLTVGKVEKRELAARRKAEGTSSHGCSPALPRRLRVNNSAQPRRPQADGAQGGRRAVTVKPDSGDHQGRHEVRC